MKVKYISYLEKGSTATGKASEGIAAAISRLTKTEITPYEVFSDHKEMAEVFKKELNLSNVIVFCVDIRAFVRTKGVICNTLGLKCEKDKTVLRMLDSGLISAELNDNQKAAQAAIPVGSKPFITYDGLFSGFVIKQTNQRIVVLPADDKRVDARLLIELSDFLSADIETYSTPMVDEEAEKKRREENEKALELKNAEALAIEQKIAEALATEKKMAEELEQKRAQAAELEQKKAEARVLSQKMEEELQQKKAEAKLLQDKLAAEFPEEVKAEEEAPAEEKAEETPEEAVEAPAENEAESTETVEFAPDELFADVDDDFAVEEAEAEESEKEESPEEIEDYSSQFIDIPLDDYVTSAIEQTDEGIEIVPAEVAKKIGDDFDVIPRTLENILKANIKIALNLQMSNANLIEYVNSLHELGDSPNFAVVPDNNEYDISTEAQCKQAVSDAARSAMKKARASAGMALSDVYSSEDGKNFVYAALCDSSKTNVYKIFSLEGEDPSNLVDIGVNSLFEVLNKRIKDYLQSSNGKGNKKGMSLVTQITIWVIVIIVLITLMGIGMKSYFNQGFVYRLFSSNAFIDFNNIFPLL